jgi:tetratricopeptide (TPR) repeat protein
MMNPLFRWMLPWCALLLLNACVRSFFPDATVPRPTQELAEEYRRKALAHEKQGELQEALFAWRVVVQLDDTNTLAPRVIETLERGIAKAAQVHFERGQRHYRADRHDDAAREFLITLRVAPGHQRAAFYLRHRVHHRPSTVYTVRSGDSFTRIAYNFYGDANLGYVIAYYNDLDPRKPLLTGKTLRLPIIERTAPHPRSDQRNLLESAAQALAKRQYETVIDLFARLAPGTSYYAHAVRLADEARYRWGLQLYEQRQYLSALEQLKQVSEGFKGRTEAIARARKQLQNEDTAAKIKVAQAFMHQKAHERAINVLEEILSIEADHAEAEDMLQSARYALSRSLLDAHRESEALQILSALGPDYQDAAQWAAQARGRLIARAETLYRKGVKYFLAEELELAVESWEQALELNPDHPKARQDIENALRLLDRWRGLGQKE